MKILGQLCREDLVELCRLNNWCLPGIYPFCFPHQFRSGRLGQVPLLEKTASGESSWLLNSMLELYGEFRLPKHIIIKDEESHKSAYLSPNILSPTSAFSFIEEFDSFAVVATVSPEAIDGLKHLETDVIDDSFETDKDTLYCYHGPAPSPSFED